MRAVHSIPSLAVPLTILLASAGSALAADLGPNGLVQLVPPGPITGGGPPVELFVVALEPDGTPVTGAKLKTVRTIGFDRTWTEVGGGVYKIAFQPPPVLAPSAIDVTARGKSPHTKTKLALSQPLELQPPRPTVAVSSNLPSMTLGRDPETSINVSGTALAGVRMRASVGKLAAIDVLPGGGAVARYEPPKLNYPQNALIVVADATQPLDRTAHLVLKLVGNASYPVAAQPGAKVSLQIGDKVFGPVVADASGSARVPVEVPPGPSTAVQIVETNGTEQRSELDLQIPETRRIALFPLPPDLPADPRTSVPIRVLVVDASGAPDPSASPAFEVPGGAVSAVTHRGEGVYEATWTLPEAPGTGTVRVTLGSEVQTDSQDLTFLHRRPASVTLVPAAGEIGPDTETVEVVAHLEDSDGKPISGATLAVAPAAAALVGSVTDRGNGDYAFTLDPEDAGEVGATITVTSGTSRSPAASVRIATREEQIASDGSAGTEVVLLALDAVGLPVAGAVIRLEKVGGGGALEPAEVTTGPDGTAVAKFASGADPAMTGLVASAGGAVGRTPLLQLPADVAPIALPAGAAGVGLGALGLGGAIPRLALPRASAPGASSASPWGASDGASDGAAEAPEAPAPTPPAPEPPAAAGPTLGLTTDLAGAEAKRGDKIHVTATPRGEDGAPAADLVPEITVTGATAAPPAKGEDGTVTVEITVAEDASGPIEIVAKAGEVEERITIPVAVPVDPWAVGAGEVAAAPVPAEPAPAEPAPQPQPATASSFRWLRVRAAGVASSYRYAQQPSELPGQLLPSRLAVGGSDEGAGSPAAPVGGELDARAWGDVVDVPYVGLHGQARLARYGIESTAFNNVARDMLNNVEISLVGRLPMDLGGDRYWVGLEGGFLYGDFLMFTGCLEPGCQVNFSPVPVPGLGVGGAVGADIGRLSIVGDYTLGLAMRPYANAVDLEAGYEFVDHVSGNLGMSVISRTVELEGIESGLTRGSLTDSQMMIKLGVGFAL